MKRNETKQRKTESNFSGFFLSETFSVVLPRENRFSSAKRVSELLSDHFHRKPFPPARPVYWETLALGTDKVPHRWTCTTGGKTERVQSFSSTGSPIYKHNIYKCNNFQGELSHCSCLCNCKTLQCSRQRWTLPFLQVIQGNIARRTDAGLLLPPLPLHQLLFHQYVDKVLGFIQEFIYVKQRIL